MRSSPLVAAPLLALSLLAQALPARAADSAASGQGANALTAKTAPGSASERNWTAWIEQVEADPNKFDQNLEEECIATGNPACSLSRAQIQHIPGEVKEVESALVTAITKNKELEAELRADLTTPTHQTRSAASLASVFGSIAKAVPQYKAVQTLAKNNGIISKFSDVASSISYANLEAQDVRDPVKKKHFLVAASKTVIYSMPIFGDLFSLGEALLDPSMSTGQRVETGVVATISLIGTVAAFAGGPVGLAVASLIGVGVAAYYVGKAIWGWLAAGSDFNRPPTTPEQLYERGAYLEWEDHTVETTRTDPFTHKTTQVEVPVTMTIPLTGEGQTRTVSQTLLVDSRWTDYAKHGEPITYDFVPYGPYNTPQALYVRTEEWGATKATITVAQDGTVKSGTCHDTGPTRGQLSPFFECAPKSTVRISSGHPAVITVTYTYSMDWHPAELPDIRGIDASLSVDTVEPKTIELDLPFRVAITAK